MGDHSDIDHTGLTGVGGSVATDAIFDAKGDLPAGTGANTASKLTVGDNDTMLMADSGQSTGLKWVASQTPSTQAFSDSAAEGTADTYARGDHKHGMPANPGGGATYGQAVPYPASFSGDTDDCSSLTPWVDVAAFDVSEILNSTVMHLVTKGASKDQSKRKTLGTTKAAAFDFRCSLMPDLTFWSSAGDAYIELRYLTSGGTQVAGFKFLPLATFTTGVYAGYQIQVYGGGGYVTSNVQPLVPHGSSVVCRVVRDGSDKLLYYTGNGQAPMALRKMLQQSDDAPYNPTQSGTIARVEIAIHTPSGPGGSAEFGVYMDYFESA